MSENYTIKKIVFDKRGSPYTTFLMFMRRRKDFTESTTWTEDDQLHSYTYFSIDKTLLIHVMFQNNDSDDVKISHRRSDHKIWRLDYIIELCIEDTYQKLMSNFLKDEVQRYLERYQKHNILVMALSPSIEQMDKVKYADNKSILNDIGQFELVMRSNQEKLNILREQFNSDMAIFPVRSYWFWRGLGEEKWCEKILSIIISHRLKVPFYAPFLVKKGIPKTNKLTIQIKQICRVLMSLGMERGLAFYCTIQLPITDVDTLAQIPEHVWENVFNKYKKKMKLSKIKSPKSWVKTLGTGWD